MTIKDQWVKDQKCSKGYSAQERFTEGRRDVNYVEDYRLDTHTNTFVRKPVLGLLDELENNIMKAQELVSVLEQNLQPVLSVPGPTESKTMEYTGDSTVGAKICNFNFEMEILLDRLSDICARINL